MRRGMTGTPSAQYSLTLRVEIDHLPGMLGKVASAIGAAGATIGAVDLVEVDAGHTIRDITVETSDAADWPRLTAAVNAVEGARVLDTTDRTFMLHIGGKIEIRNKSPLKTRDDLSMAYTPGVARVCEAIHDDPDKAFQYTIKRNTVAVVSDGTAVLGPGRHRAAGGDAGDGGQGDAVQGVRRRRRVPDLPRHQGSGRDRRRRQGDRAGVRRHQPRGHLGAALLRDRVAAEARARHPGVPRRPARDRRRGAGGAAQRADSDRPADRRRPGRDRRAWCRRDGGHADPAGGGRPPHHRLRLARGRARRSGRTTWMARWARSSAGSPSGPTPTIATGCLPR